MTGTADPAGPVVGPCIVPSCPMTAEACTDHPQRLVPDAVMASIAATDAQADETAERLKRAAQTSFTGTSYFGPVHPSRLGVPSDIPPGWPAERPLADRIITMPSEGVEWGTFPLAPPERPDWTMYFLDLADTVSRRADCTRRQVGAVLVSEGNEVLGTGYNGAPAGVPGCASAGACPRGQRSYAEVPPDVAYDQPGQVCTADHAERNAVVRFLARMRRLGVSSARALEELRHARVYVTCEPCPQCYAFLEAVGISDITWPDSSD